MALNDYEHVNEARQLASAEQELIKIAKAGLGPEDILPIMAQVTIAIQPIQAVLNAEDKAEAEVKFLAVSQLVLISRIARDLPDSKLKENLLAIADFGQKELEINLPDEA